MQGGYKYNLLFKKKMKKVKQKNSGENKKKKVEKVYRALKTCNHIK